MDNVCNRCLFSIPSKVEMAEEQEYLRFSKIAQSRQKLIKHVNCVFTKENCRTVKAHENQEKKLRRSTWIDDLINMRGFKHHFSQ